MIIGITGGTGFIGRHLQKRATQRHDDVILFSRHPKENSSHERLFTTSTLPNLNRCEGLVHLAGESLLGLWTREKRKQILESRLEGTRRLVEGIAHATVKPKVLLSASGIGYYGSQDDLILDESSPAGSGFLSEVTQCWEEEALKATSLGVRVICLRFGLVLGRHGGILKVATPFFRLGLGASLGTGSQWMSCIQITDLVDLILYALHDEKIEGIMNAVMPHPCTNKSFTQAMAHSLHRPNFFCLPSWLLKSLLGNASQLLLDSQRVLPTKASLSGFHFRYPTIGQALSREIKKPSGLGL